MIHDASAAAVVARVIDAAKRRLGARYRATYVWGSHARGDAIETSDVDVGVFVTDAPEGSEQLISDDVVAGDAALDARLDFILVPAAGLDGRDAVSFRLGALHVDGEDLADSLPLPSRDEYVDLRDEVAVWWITRHRAKPVPRPLPPHDAADEFLGYVRRTTVAGGRVVPSTKEALAVAGGIASALVARASGRFVGDRPQAIAAYVEDVGDAWAPFLVELQDSLRTRWTYLVPEDATDRRRFAELCAQTLAFERLFFDLLATGPRGPRTEASWREAVRDCPLNR